MKNVFSHLTRHVTKHAKIVGDHLKEHHKKYVFGIFGGFAVVKLFLLLFGVSLLQYTRISTFADLESGCTLTGQYYTGEYYTGEYLTGQETVDSYLTGCITISGHWTGGALDESGVLTGQTRVEEQETGCILVDESSTGGTLTGAYLTGGYRTGGNVICDAGTVTSDASALGNGICESGDIIWTSPLSGSQVRNIFSFVWSYSGTDCISSGLSLQVRDHNAQWINLGTVNSGASSLVFDSQRLYNYQHSGYYHVLGTGTSGQQIYLYTGTHTGTYSHVFTGYLVKLLNSGQVSLYESSRFTIDNEYPLLTGISLLSGGLTSGYLNTSGRVTLSFIASEILSGLQVTLGSGNGATSLLISGLVYTYTRNLSGVYPEGALVANILFADLVGNTGRVVYTGGLIFDTIKPIVTGFVFGAYTGGLSMNFSGSEPIRYTSNYRQTGGVSISGTNLDYLNSQQIVFSGLERDHSYLFTLDVYDRAGNSVGVTGDIFRSTSGAILSHVYVAPVLVVPTVVASGTLLTGSLTGLATIFKVEIDKFTACKSGLSYSPIELEVRRNKFVLQMPAFKKSQVKTLVNGFTLFVLDKVKKNYSIDSGDIAGITKKFNNFLIVLKLLRDDDNNCKQNLSNYYISQFRQALKEYKINLD